MEYPQYQLAVLGCNSIGKSAITIQYCSNHFIEEWDPTIEDHYQKQFSDTEEGVLRLDILDTAGFDASDIDDHSCDENYRLGAENSRSLRTTFMKNGQGFILAYDITFRESFLEIPRFYELVLRAKDSEIVPIVLCGNKLDLAKEKREVETKEGANLAEKWKIPFFETSAKNFVNINESFKALIKLIRVQEKNEKKKKQQQKKEKRLSINIITIM